MSNRLHLLIGVLALMPAATIGTLLGLGVDLHPTTDYHPTLPSQQVACELVDEAIAPLPRGDGNGVVTAAEIGPGGWHHGATGRRFTTMGFRLTESGDGYEIVTGRSKVGENRNVVNDYPRTLDQASGYWEGVLEVHGPSPAITVSGDPGLRVPTPGPGAVRIELRDASRDGAFEGCAQSPYTMIFRSVGPNGGDLMQRDYFKLSAEVDADGTVTYLEVTEIDLFRELSREGLRVAAHRR